MPIFGDKPQNNSTKSSGIFSFVIQFFVVGLIFFVIGFAAGQKKVEFLGAGPVPEITIQNQTPKNTTIDFSLLWDVLSKIP